jgi:4-hydroxyacetophenone monooxygenase
MSGKINTRLKKEGSQAAPDESLIRRALDSANLNVLRMALYQVTKDPALAAMRTTKIPVRQGAMWAPVLAGEHASEVKEKALAFLTGKTPSDLSPPTEQESRRLMEIFSGESMSDQEFRLGLEELALDEFPRDVKWNAKTEASVLQAFHVIIIGVGISGLAGAIQLKRLGIPFTIVERQEGIGGTWWLNDYPDARVDTSSYLYQFKFEKNYPWSEFCASRNETRRYLEYLAKKYGVIENIRFGAEVTAATWDETSSKWHVTLRARDGGEQKLTSNVVISATGTFATANLPDIPGIKDFEGRMFHTTKWDHSYDYSGKRVALIGNGSSGTQLMPVVAKVAKSLTAYQRTPNWISALDGYKERVSPEIRWLFDNVPYYWNWYCYSSYAVACQLQEMQTYDPEWRKTGGAISERNDKLRAVLTDYIRSKVGEGSRAIQEVRTHLCAFGASSCRRQRLVRRFTARQRGTGHRWHRADNANRNSF